MRYLFILLATLFATLLIAPSAKAEEDPYEAFEHELLTMEAQCYSTLAPSSDGGFRHGGDVSICRSACFDDGSSWSCFSVGIDQLEKAQWDSKDRKVLLASAGKYITRGCALEGPTPHCVRARLTLNYLTRKWGKK